MDTDDLQTIYAALQLAPLRPCSAERQKLAQHSRLQPFSLGATLFREGEAATDPMLPLSGMVKLCRHSAQGKECVLHLVRPGRLLDAGVLFYEEGLPVTAIGVQAGTVLRIERKALLESLHNEGALGLAPIKRHEPAPAPVYKQDRRFSGRISVSGRAAAWLPHRAKMEKAPH